MHLDSSKLRQIQKAQVCEKTPKLEQDLGLRRADSGPCFGWGVVLDPAFPRCHLPVAAAGQRAR